ncbi:hypothetical protein [Paenibacillus harenae]|uniref:hypothetical protein n=1 Tax=Paenibacillus harenae TaxID=306543 RepID=UPI0027942EDB|nr:hypothetical protein [Paenibacillus harenae]MDQ0063407.1 hypothetical protein [Paenibacillus harenae]
MEKDDSQPHPTDGTMMAIVFLAAKVGADNGRDGVHTCALLGISPFDMELIYEEKHE